MRVLLDTCIVIDALQSREPFCVAAQKIFIAAASAQINGIISAKALTDIYYLVHRHTHDNKEAWDVLNKLITIFDVSDTAGIDCQRAIVSEISDYEDAVMAETAQRIGADCIVTRNIRDYARSPVPAVLPEDLLKTVERDS